MKWSVILCLIVLFAIVAAKNENPNSNPNKCNDPVRCLVDPCLNNDCKKECISNFCGSCSFTCSCETNDDCKTTEKCDQNAQRCFPKSSKPAPNCDVIGCTGPAPLSPNVLCSDGSVGGPVCTNAPNGDCVWTIRSCPE